MYVFYFTSNLFVSVTATSIVSLLENNKRLDHIYFYIVDDGIEKKNREMLTDLINSYNRKVTYIVAPDPNKLFDFPFKSRYQIGHSYVRMCVGKLLPQNIDRVLCLDSDTLILGGLTDLWELDMEDNIIAGVADCMDLRAYRKQFHLKGKEFYCNAGMFLIDLKKWREQNVEEQIKRIIQQQNGNVFFFEQTLINYACKGKIYKLHPKYNSYTLFYAFSYENLIQLRKPTIFYTKEEVDEGISHPLIVHYTRNFYMLSRPWIKACDHPMTRLYLQYKEMTPWKILNSDTRSRRQKFTYKFWHLMPQKWISVVAGVAYNKIRPQMWWKNE